MAVLNANALTDLTRTKAELSIPTTVLDHDDQVIQYINVISDMLEEICNRKFVNQNFVHRFTGRGSNWLVAKEFPVTAINNIWVDGTYAFAAPLAATDYFLQDEIFFVRLGESSFWPGGPPLSIQIDYDAGYTTIPDGLQQACIEWVRLLYLAQGDRRIGRTSKSKVGESISWEGEIPAIVQSLISPYKRSKSIVRALSLNEVFSTNGIEDHNAEVE